MNKIEHYIKKIHNVKDVTEEYSKYAGWKNSSKPIVKVDMTVDSYGVITRVSEVFSEYEWNKIKQQGYYLG